MNITEKRKLVAELLTKCTASVDQKYATEVNNEIPQEEPETPELTVRQEELCKAIDGKFGCREDEVRKLIEVITGEKLPTPVKVPQTSRELHEVSEAKLPVYSTVIDRDGDTVHISSIDDVERRATDGLYSEDLAKFMRLATEKEIKKYVKEMEKDVLDTQFGFLFI